MLNKTNFGHFNVLSSIPLTGVFFSYEG